MKTLEKKTGLGNASAEIDGNSVKITGPKGTVQKEFREKLITISIKDKSIMVRAANPNRSAKRIMNSASAHIANMVRGVSEGYEYKLKICSGHFPMNVSVAGKEILIKNFIGEKHPRKCRIKGNVEIRMEKDIIALTGIDKDQVGQAAADIEKTTRITHKDRRIFMDGIYIISKGQEGK